MGGVALPGTAKNPNEAPGREGIHVRPWFAVAGGIVPADATSVLSLFLMLQFLLPPLLVVQALGSAGRPAQLVGLAALMLVAWGFLGSPLRSAGHVPAVWVAVLLFLGSALASYASGFTRDLLPVEVRAMNRYMLLALSLAGVTLLTAIGIDSRERLIVLLRRLVLLVSVMAALGIVQFIAGIDIARMIRVPGLVELAVIVTEDRSIFSRVQSTTLHPIEFSVVLASVTPLALHLAVFEPTAHRWWSYLQLAVIAAAVPMAISRSGVLCLVITLSIVIASWPSRLKLRAMVAGMLFLVAMRVTIPGLLGTIKALFLYIAIDPSTAGRTSDYAVVGAFINERPWLGRGPYTFLPELYRILDNQYLVTLIDSGIVGLVALLMVFVIATSLAASIRRKTTDPVTRNLAQSILAAVVGIAATFATFDALSFPTFTTLVFLLLGIAGAVWRFPDSSSAR